MDKVKVKMELQAKNMPAVHAANSLLSGYKITLRKMGGFLNAPTPGGVPVRNTSPGINVTNLSGGEKAQSGISELPSLQRIRIFFLVVVQYNFSINLD